MTKIIKATLGFTMAIGMGVSAGFSGQTEKPVLANQGDTITDTITNQETSGLIGSTGSTAWTDISITGSSGAVYQIHTMGLNGTSNAFRWNKNGYLYVSTNPGSNYKIKSITIAGASKTVDIYGSATAYTAKATATKDGSVTATTSGATYTYKTQYFYAAVNGTVSSTEISSISFVWEEQASKTTTTTSVSAAGDKTSLDITASPVDTVQLSASVKYNNGANTVSNPQITWSGNNDGVATINSTGLVTAVSKGKATFTASYGGDATYSESSGTIVIKVIDPSELIFDFAELASANAWENDTQYTPITFNGATLSVDGTGGKWYVSDNTYRVYNGNTLSVSAPSGKSITSISSVPACSFTVSNDGSSASASFNATTKLISVTLVLGEERILQSISAELTDSSKTWNVNDVVSASDLTIIPHYNNGDGESITDGAGVIVTNGKLNNAGDNTVNVSYGGKSTTVTVNAHSSTVVAWSITGSIGSTVKSTSYDLSGLTLHAYYDAGMQDEASSAVADLYELVANPEKAGNTPDSENTISVEVYLKADTEHSNCLKVFSNVPAPIANSPKGSADNPYTVAEARAAIDAGSGITGVYATGIVSQIVTAFNSDYGNISYNISADGTTTSDQLQAFRGKDKDGEKFTSADDVEVGATVIVFGNLTKYNSTYEFAADNQLFSYTAPSADSKIKSYLNSASSVAELRGAEQRTSSIASESIVFGDLGLDNGVQYLDPFDGGHFTIKFAGGDNDGKYYTTGSGIRVYGGGSFTIESAEDIYSVQFTWDGSNKPTSDNVADCGAFDNETSIWTNSDSDSSVTFARPSGSGHWRLKSLSVSYGRFQSVASVNVRFGAKFPVATWNAINALDGVSISDYGVMLFRTTEARLSTVKSVEEYYNEDPANVTIIRKNSGVPSDPVESFYDFSVQININTVANYSRYYCAAPFIVAGGNYYFLPEMRYSVNLLAQYYQSNPGCDLSAEALQYLATTH